MRTYNPFEMPEDQKKDCNLFRVKRANQAIGDVRGFYGSRDNRIQIVDQNEIARGDWVSDLADGREFFVLGVDQKKIEGHWTDTILIVQNSEDYARSKREPATSMNISIGSVTGDRNIIGNAKDVRIRVTADDILGLAGSLENGDREALCDLYQELKRCEREHDMPDKSRLHKLKGFFGRHSDVINMLGQWFIMAVMNLE